MPGWRFYLVLELKVKFDAVYVIIVFCIWAFMNGTKYLNRIHSRHCVGRMYGIRPKTLTQYKFKLELTKDEVDAIFIILNVQEQTLINSFWEYPC